ncbi:branched-chain amino acid ABC transporter ATP-binding protein [Burkholderia thailandensis]|nr:branched-chain amino acid ABC transporter ATP-binding protein [Burkholderia thailandensis]NOK40682.1 branched-chain amino acid ABC transporter ATP-binding protein [Burkholderia thailandensis]NOK54174.1 branched-chain amino acid ABC transporter ATP-binding protein [Burkholderia thailandensis]PNE68849.1 branched-chain amino acid ABC transporter ATP-binding protein [Burkholderia thailandensis]PNE80871.1 branched-chain amino acid ABC transporter ATP-binding protein [Burkholderia thailandensis]
MRACAARGSTRAQQKQKPRRSGAFCCAAKSRAALTAA